MADAASFSLIGAADEAGTHVPGELASTDVTRAAAAAGPTTDAYPAIERGLRLLRSRLGVASAAPTPPRATASPLLPPRYAGCETVRAGSVDHADCSRVTDRHDDATQTSDGILRDAALPDDAAVVAVIAESSAPATSCPAAGRSQVLSASNMAAPGEWPRGMPLHRVRRPQRRGGSDSDSDNEVEGLQPRFSERVRRVVASRSARAAPPPRPTSEPGQGL